MSWKKWGFKVAKNAVYVVIAGLGVKYGGADWFIVIAPGLIGLENYLKHRK